MQGRIPAGSLKRIHAHPNSIRDHVRFGTEGPVLTIELEDGALFPVSRVIVQGRIEFVQHLHAPLESGARVWAETTEEVTYE